MLEVGLAVLNACLSLHARMMMFCFWKCTPVPQKDGAPEPVVLKVGSGHPRVSWSGFHGVPTKKREHVFFILFYNLFPQLNNNRMGIVVNILKQNSYQRVGGKI